MSDVFDRLRGYFQGIADSLASDRTASRVFPNRSDAGATREDVLLTFLSQHVPARCHAVRGGFIFDSEGKESKQIDLIVTNDLTLQFRRFDDGTIQGKSFSVIEGCYAAISVKSSLDKAQLVDALANVASIPPMPDPGPRFNPLGPRRDQYMNLPLKVIFAFDGLSRDTIFNHLCEYLERETIPTNRWPDLIIVNNQYVIQYLHEGGELSDGTKIPAGVFVPIWHEHVGAYSLIHLVSRIQQAANYGSVVLMNSDAYVNAMMGIPVRSEVEQETET